MKGIFIVFAALISFSLVSSQRRKVYRTCAQHGQLCTRWDETVGMCTLEYDIKNNPHLVCRALDGDKSGYGSYQSCPCGPS